MKLKIGNNIVHYQVFGTGKPILCIHGFPEDHQVLVGCIEPNHRMLDGYRRIYVDLPGMGKSIASTDIKNADDMLDVLHTFIKTIIKNEPFLLVGLSYGGYLSLGLLQKFDLNIDGVFLICPCTVANHERRSLPLKPDAIIDDRLEPFAFSQEFTDFLSFAVIANVETWQRYQHDILSGLKVANQHFITLYRKDGYELLGEKHFNKIDFPKPVYVITGKQDNCVGFEDSWNVLKHLPQLTFLKVDNAGHNLQIEQPLIFTDFLRAWLFTDSQ